MGASFFFRFPKSCTDEFVNQNAANATKVLALSAVAALRESVPEGATGVNLGVKWPNDITVNNGKIGGILAQAIPSTRLDGIVLGIGLNINTSQGDLQKIRRPVWPAESLKAVAGQK